MGGACSLGSKGTQNPVPKNQIRELALYNQGQMTNQGKFKNKTSQNHENTIGQMDSHKEKNSNYIESQKNQQVHLTNPFSTEQNGYGGEIGDQIYENEKIYQIGRYFLENHLSILESKGKQKWLQFLTDGQNKLRKMNEQKRNEIFTKNNLDFIVNYTEKYLTVNVSLGKESQLNEFIEKGLIPQSDRWSAWKVKLNVQKYYVKGKYQRLLKKECICEKAIKKDIGRAFPEQKFFKIDERLQYSQRYANLNSSPFKDFQKNQQQQEKQNFEHMSSGIDSKQNQINSLAENESSINQAKFDDISISQQQKIQTGLKGTDKSMKNNYSIFKKESGNKDNQIDEQQISNEQQTQNGQQLKDQTQLKQQQYLNELQKQQKSQRNSIQTNNKNQSEIQKDSIQSQIDQFIEGDESPRRFLSQMSNQMKINQKNNQLDKKQRNEFENNTNDNNEQEAYMRMQSVGQQSLLNVLHAISNYFPDFRYTQGMNMVIGFFLLVNGGIEEEAFWMFVSLARSEKYLIMGLYENYFPLIDLTKFIFDQKFEEYLPNLHYHIRQTLEVFYEEWFFQWVITFFLDKFSLQQAIRFWDFIISQDSLFSLIQISLSLLKELQQNIIGVDHGQFHSLFNGFKNQHNLWDKSSPQFIDLEKVLKNAKKIKLTKQYIAQQTQNYLTSKSNIISNKQRLNVYSSFFLEINQKSQIKQRQSLDILNSEINSRIVPDQQLPQVLFDDEDDDNKLANQVKKLKESSDLPKLQNQLSKIDDKQKEHSERQVITKPQIDYMSSDNEYKLPRLKNSPVKSQMGERNNNFSFLPPIQQKKKDKDSQQINVPDENNESAKYKLKTIKFPQKSNDDQLDQNNQLQISINNKNQDQKISYQNEISQENTEFLKGKQSQQTKLPLINIQQKQFNDISQTQETQKTQPQLRHSRTLSQRNNDIHVTSLDQIDMNQQPNSKENQDEKQIEKKKNIPFFKFIQSNIIGDLSSPSSKYFFNSPNKSSKKIQRSTTQNFNKDSSKSQYGNNKQKQNKARRDNQTLNNMVNKTQEIYSHQENNSNSNFDPQIVEERNQQIIQHQSSNSQTSTPQNNRGEDFNKNNNNQMVSNQQSTNSQKNIQNNFSQSQQNFISNNKENDDNKLKTLQLHKNSQSSSRPSSHYSSMEYYNRQQKQNLKQQPVNAPQNYLQNLSAFSTPKVKQKQLQPLSFSKMASVATKLQSQSLSEINNFQQSEQNNQIKQDSNNQLEKNTPINKNISHELTPHSINSLKVTNQMNSPSSISINDLQKKFKPTSNTLQNSEQQQSMGPKSLVNMEELKNIECKDNIDQNNVFNTPKKQNNLKEEQVNKFSNRKQIIQQEQTNRNDRELDLKNEKQSSSKKQYILNDNVKQFNTQNMEIEEKDIISLSNIRQFQIQYDPFLKNSNTQQDQNQKQEQLNTITFNSNKKESQNNNDDEEAFNQIIQQSSSSSSEQLPESPIKQLQNHLILETETQEQSEKVTIIPDQQEDDNITDQIQSEHNQENKEEKNPQIKLMGNLIEENLQIDQTNKDSIFQTETKKDDLFYSQNIQNSQHQADISISGYINEIPQHNISGYSIQLQNISNVNGIQNTYQNSQFQNQAKEFSANQIPSLNNSRIHDDAQSQISEISYGYNNQIQYDQQNDLNIQKIIDNLYQQKKINSQIKQNVDLNDVIGKIRDNLMNQSGLENINLQKVKKIQNNENSLTDRNIKYENKRDRINSNFANQDNQISNYSIKNNFNNSPMSNQQQNLKSGNQQLTPKTNYQQKIQSTDQLQSTPKTDNSMQKIDSMYQTPKTNRNDTSVKTLQTEVSQNSLNNSAQQIQRNYIKSNSLNQLSNVASQNILNHLQNSPNQQLSNQNYNKHKNKNNSILNNASSSQTVQQISNQMNGILNNNDKVNNYVAYSNSYQISQLQEIQEENYNESGQKQPKSKKYQGYDSSPVYKKGIIEDIDNDNSQQQNKLNNSIISSKTNQSHRSKISLANQQYLNDIENQNDILNELSHSQFYSNSSVIKPPQKPQSTTQISMHLRKSSLNKNPTQNQQHSDHTHLRIISSAAQKNLVQGSQSSICDNPQTSNSQFQQKNYLPKPQPNLSPSQNIYNKQSKEYKKNSKKSSLTLSKVYKE